MVKAIVGANWGDEGKGKITDVLANDSDIVIRFQGGANAGHTIVNDYGKFALHQLPSGVFHQNITNIIGNGVAFSVENFVKEMAHLKDRGVPEPNIIISDRAQIVMPYHVAFDCYEEERLGKNSFGSTKSGIAPFYSDKYSKIGFQINELYDDPDSLREKIRHALEIKNAPLKNLYNKPEITEQEVFDKLMEYKELLAPYVGDAFTFVHNALKDGKNILLEGQLGSLKDTDFGIYPMVTSSNTIAGYGAVGAGIPPYEIKEIITVVKAYSSAVGAGEFVSEIFGDEADELRRRGGDGGEFGATTGRPRRMGWLDLVATRYGCMVQGATQVAFTVILMKSLFVWVMSLTARKLTTSRQQQSLKDANLSSKSSRAGSVQFQVLQNMTSFLRNAVNTLNLPKRLSVCRLQWFQTVLPETILFTDN